MRSIAFIKSISMLSLATALLLSACGPDGGANASGDDGGEQTADAGVGVVTGASQFLGTWVYESGAGLISCSDGSSGEIQAGGGTVTFTAGANGSRVVAVSDTNCAVACMISGTTATCEQGTCEIAGGTRATVQSDVFTLTGGQLHETSAIQLANSDGSTCNFALEDSVLQKTH